MQILQRPDGSWVALIVACAAAFAHAQLVYVDFITDDAYISFRYADRLRSGQGLSWTDGPPVEGYTDLGWVLGVALLDLFGIGHLDGARALGIAGLWASVAVSSLDPLALRPELRRIASGGALIALTGSIAAWAFGGLEQTALAGCIALAALGAVRVAEGGRGELLTSVALGIAVLLRADALVLAAGVLIGGALATRQIAPWVRAGLLPIALLIGQQAHRMWWFGDWVPNTARVKVSGTPERAWIGLKWVASGLLQHSVLLAAALAVIPAGWRSARVIVPGVAALLWCCYVAAVGGDIFEAWRQLVPAVPLFAMLASEAAVRSSLGERSLAAVLAIVLALHTLVANTGHQARARLPRYEWDVAPLAQAMVSAWGDLDPLLAVDAAGVLPYWTRFRSLDMLGLNDAWLPRHPPSGYGRENIGHDLGDPDYVMRMQPDIVAFNSGLGTDKPRWVAGRALVRRKDFLSRYQLVRFRVGEIVAPIYIRRDGGPLGVSLEGDPEAPARVVVPPWLLGSDGSDGARPHRGTFLVRVSEDRPGRVHSLVVPAGRWAVKTDPSTLTARATCGERSGRSFTLTKPRAIDLELSAPELTWARGLSLERITGETEISCDLEARVLQHDPATQQQHRPLR